MLLELLKSKLHQACITAGSLDYPGSIGISRELMDAVGLLHYERVLVSNLRDGARFETYVIPEEQPGQIVLNGAAAHLGRIGDRVIIMCFVRLHPDELAAHKPRIAVLNELNEIVGGDY